MAIRPRYGKGQSGLHSTSVSGAMSSEGKLMQKPHHLDNVPTKLGTQAIGEILSFFNNIKKMQSIGQFSWRQ